MLHSHLKSKWKDKLIYVETLSSTSYKDNIDFRLITND